MGDEPRTEEEADEPAEETEESEESDGRTGETRGGEDSSEEHYHLTGDGGEYSGGLQWQDLQPGGDKAGDDWTFPEGVLNLLQAGEAWTSRNRSHSLFTIHSSQINK